MKICSECGTTRFGLIRHRWGRHHFCSKLCMERFKKRVEVEGRKFVAWLSGRSGTGG